MINPAQYIAFVEKLNELEATYKKVRKYGLPLNIAEALNSDLTHYSVQWDGEASRWTLVSETDDAPNLCSFNQTQDECSETDLCERCWQVQQELAEEHDRAHG